MAGARWVLIGNPDNRRVTHFEAAFQQAQQEAHRSPSDAPLLVFAHDALLDDTAVLTALADEPLIVRLDACGEDNSVTRKLLTRGHERAAASGVETVAPDALAGVPRHGEIVAPTQLHYGFTHYLAELGGVFASRPSWRVLQRPDDVAACFDKRATHTRLAEAGLPVADALPPVTTPDELRAAMHDANEGAVFVKHRYSSSASCLGVYHRDGQHLMTTVAEREGGRFNSLKVQRCEGERAERVLSFLLREGAHIERVHPKARLDDAYFDLRVLVVDGVPAFTVVRQSRHIITNLHLGGWRGDVAALEALLGQSALADVYETCVLAAGVTGLFHAGVDVLVEPDLKTHRVLEVNAFGDLLPNLERDGKGVYGWQIARAAGEV